MNEEKAFIGIVGMILIFLCLIVVLVDHEETQRIVVCAKAHGDWHGGACIFPKEEKK